ncbi:hypothetical protein LQG66_17245 [Bradyrhizobium ontarionense]|uniref:S1/P1 Nuclease n=1 Tax=Bradyrhizobium ontarionense TaxID=2898149 RepID=A0ABY3RN03_9BRAD|nr:hypothetical protein [Bradyrhizobium sp. A19]UFZ07934.1 hypothetical protein LQG66_17245 [Bradyrhizobium sp. A19]
MVRPQPQIDLSAFQAEDDFAHLSLKNLVDARELFHVHLMRHPNVVATALGRYRIRSSDSWPHDKVKRHGAGVRRLDNSQVRSYSWPCILVFVSEWQDPKELSRPGELIPSTVFMPDGSRVPICVVEAPKEQVTPIEAPNRIVYPINNIGPGNPLIATVQGQQYVATIGALVSDGHLVYALTNRHVTGDEGEVVSAIIAGAEERVGESSDKQLTRLPFSALYPNFVVSDTFVNLDVGMVEIDDISRWTTAIKGLGRVGPMADFSGINLSLSLVGCYVRGIGAAGGTMLGEIHGLFYRYKKQGGFEYVADLMIGARTQRRGSKERPPGFATFPGDSGALWLLEPAERIDDDGRAHRNGGRNGAHRNGTSKKHEPDASEFMPLAMQWGRNMFRSTDKAPPQSFVLATLLSRVCAMLEVDFLQDWNIDQPDTWGALGHFSIASRALGALSNRLPKLKALMDNNLQIISHDDAKLKQGEFKGMGSEDFVPMADVPDFFWKPRVGKQGFARKFEGSNHFADMDQPGPGGKTLLDLTKDDANVDPDIWERFYDNVTDILSGDKIKEDRRGLLPFRVWQIFDKMCDYAKAGKAEEFVCAAGVLAHYVGDSCQPLHISYLHDGDPERPVKHVFSKGKKAGQTKLQPLGSGVHSAYEDAMVFQNRVAILDGLKQTAKVQQSELVGSGREAAIATIRLMRNTFKAVPPAKIVQAYVDIGKGGNAASSKLWSLFGRQTIGVMQDGAHLLAVLWESAWTVGEGERHVTRRGTLTPDQAMDIVKDDKFLPSLTIGQIGKVLRGRPELHAESSEPLSAPPQRRTAPPRQRRTARGTTGSRPPRKGAARSA